VTQPFKWREYCLLIGLLDCARTLTREATIRAFGVSLLAVAAVAAASLLWKRRQEELISYFEADDRLDVLRRAGL
jgi:hypothetical protein